MQPDGSYRLQFTRDRFGAVTGSHNVEIRRSDEMTGNETAIHKVESVEVKKGENTLDWDLPATAQKKAKVRP